MHPQAQNTHPARSEPVTAERPLRWFAPGWDVVRIVADGLDDDLRSRIEVAVALCRTPDELVTTLRDLTWREGFESIPVRRPRDGYDQLMEIRLARRAEPALARPRPA